MNDDARTDTVDPSDGELLAALAVVLRQDEPVPPDAVEAAIEAFTWQAIDAELLELLHDSAVDELSATRDETESPSRLLTFRSPSVEIEITVTSDAPPLVRGAIMPAGTYRVELQQGTNRVAGASSEAGIFALTAVDETPLRVIITTGDGGARLVTPWIEVSGH
jgi:hypothetical protein